jgi:regulator of sigma E protease
MTTFLASVGDNVFILLAFIVAMSVIVFIHEFGHYIVGRWSGIYADTFSVGFGPVVIARTDKRGTQWQIALYPFGGYVKFAGDANAASVGATEQAGRHTMQGAPLWARAATVAAGPIFNFIFAILIFAGYLLWTGKPADSLIFENGHNVPAAYQSELEPGDVITAIEGTSLEQDDIYSALPDQPRFDYTVSRDGRETIVEGPAPIIPRVVGLAPRSAADDAGLRIGDVITAIDGERTSKFGDLVTAVAAAEGTPLMLTVWRNGDLLTRELSPRRVDLPLPEGGFETRWMIGITGDTFFEAGRVSVGPWEALSSGSEQLWWRITTSLSGLWNIVNGSISTCNLSGPVGIAQASGSMAAQGTGSFILFIGVLSAAVGLLNLFPIPILDGGHLVFHAYEAISRRKPSENALKYLMIGGLSLIGMLMTFAILNDLIFCP